VLTSLTNEERKAYDAPPLQENELLTKAAELKAADMAAKGYFAHTSPEGHSPWYWLSLVGYKYASAGENLAVNFYDSDDVSDAWMKSPTHKANIIKKEYTEIGIGVARGVYKGENTIFVAQFFGKPILPTTESPAQAPTTVASAPVSTPTTVSTAPKTQTVPKVKPVETQPKPVPVEEDKTLAVNNDVFTEINSVLGQETLTTPTPPKSFASTVRSFLQRMLTSPGESVATLYGIIASLIVTAMLIIMFVRSEIRHPKIMVRGLAMIGVIILLLYVNIQVLTIDTLVPEDNENTSFIAS
jgi:uncharacterized protein YkwD